MDFFNVVTVNEARNIIMENFSDYGFDIELIDLLDSTDRVLAFDIYSEIDVPEFDRSTVDGYGIIVEDSHGATEAIPSILNMLGEVRMGEYTKFEIKSGDSVYIPTGGMLPHDALGGNRRRASGGNDQRQRRTDHASGQNPAEAPDR